MIDKSRRTFIKQSSIIIAGASLLPSLHLTASSVNKEKLAIQLFPLNDLMNSDAAGTLKALRAIGFQYIEHSNYIDRKFYGYSPADFRKLVADSGLILLSGHTVLQLNHWDSRKKTFTTQWQQVLEDARIASQQFVISPWLDPYLWDKDKELKQFLEVLNKCGELCKKSGLQFGYHNHDFEFSRQLNDVRIYDIILRYTDAGLVKQQLDIGNINQESFSLETLFKTYPGRFQLLHLKNIVKSNRRHELYKHAALESGIIDLKTVINLARTAGGTTNIIIDQVYEEDLLHNVEADYWVFNKHQGIFSPQI